MSCKRLFPHETASFLHPYIQAMTKSDRILSLRTYMAAQPVLSVSMGDRAR